MKRLLIWLAIVAWAIEVVGADGTKPGKPTNLVAYNITSNSLSLRWNAPASKGASDIVEYKLWAQRGGNRRGWTEGERLLTTDYTMNRDGSYSYTLAFAETTRYLPNLTRDTLYRFMVSARNDHGYGDPSLESEEVRTLAEKPSGLSTPSIVGISQTGLTVTWNLASDDGGKSIAQYTVYMETSKGSFGNGIIVKSPNTKLKYSSLTSSTDYRFKVSATNLIGESVMSPASANARTLDAMVPSPPRNTQVIASDKETITVLWTIPSSSGGFPLLRYMIEFREKSGYFGIGVDVGLTTKYKISGLKPDSTYFIRVRAQNQNISLGFSPYGDDAVARTTAALGDVPKDVAAPAPDAPSVSMYGYSDHAIFVSWKIPSATYGRPYSGYQIFHRAANFGTSENATFESHHPWETTIELSATNRYHTFVSTKPGFTYQFAVSVKNVAGYGPKSLPSAPITVKATAETSKESSKDLTLDASPETVLKAVDANKLKEDVMLVNYVHDDYRGVDCAEMSMRQTLTDYVYDPHYGGNIKFVTVTFSRAFDVPPDIEQLIHVDEANGRTFELTVHSVWTSRFTIKIRRTDNYGGWNDVVVIMWRAAAPAGYRCSVRGALMHQYDMRPGFSLRVVIIAPEVNVEGDSMQIFRNVTFETDPRLKVYDPVAKGLVPAKAIIRGGVTQNGLFDIVDTNVLFRNVQLRDGNGGLGGAFSQKGGSVKVLNTILAGNNARAGGAIHLDYGKLHLENVVMENNSASVLIWDGEAQGGAIFVGEKGIVTLLKSSLSNNAASATTAHSAGGAIFSNGRVDATEVTFYKNKATGKPLIDDDSVSNGIGGAIAIVGSAAVLKSKRCHFFGNMASTGGGAIFSSGDIDIIDTTGGNNSALMGSNVRITLSSSFKYINSSFLLDDHTHYVESSELISQSGINEYLTDDHFLEPSRI
jgi:predicted outer membrane repeat protein